MRMNDLFSKFFFELLERNYSKEMPEISGSGNDSHSFDEDIDHYNSIWFPKFKTEPSHC